MYINLGLILNYKNWMFLSKQDNPKLVRLISGRIARRAGNYRVVKVQFLATSFIFVARCIGTYLSAKFE